MRIAACQLPPDCWPATTARIVTVRLTHFYSSLRFTSSIYLVLYSIDEFQDGESDAEVGENTLMESLVPEVSQMPDFERVCDESNNFMLEADEMPSFEDVDSSRSVCSSVPNTLYHTYHNHHITHITTLPTLATFTYTTTLPTLATFTHFTIVFTFTTLYPHSPCLPHSPRVVYQYY